MKVKCQLGSVMKNLPNIVKLFGLISALKIVSGCFAFHPFTPADKLNKQQFKKLPESEIVFVAKYVGTQTGTQLYFREDSIFTLQTQTAFGWEQYNGSFMKVDTADLYALYYVNEHKARWHYVEIRGDKALLKIDVGDTTRKRIKTFQVVKNVLSK